MAFRFKDGDLVVQLP